MVISHELHNVMYEVQARIRAGGIGAAMASCLKGNRAKDNTTFSSVSEHLICSLAVNPPPFDFKVLVLAVAESQSNFCRVREKFPAPLQNSSKVCLLSFQSPQPRNGSLKAQRESQLEDPPWKCPEEAKKGSDCGKRLEISTRSRDSNRFGSDSRVRHYIAKWRR